MAKKKSKDALTLEYRKADDLIIPDWNTQIHDRANIEQIKASIKEFGYADPIIIDENNVIVAGVGRLMALRELWSEGWDGVNPDRLPVIVLCGVDDRTVKKLSVALNKIQSQPDLDTLARLMQSLVDAGDSIESLTVTGFRDYEIADLIRLIQTEPTPTISITETDDSDTEKAESPPADQISQTDLFVERRFRVPVSLNDKVEEVLQRFNQFGKGAKALGYTFCAIVVAADLADDDTVNEAVQAIKLWVAKGD